MKALINRSVLFAILVIVGSTIAIADTVDLTFTSVNGASQGGVYVSPYYATLNGVPGVAIYCDDFSHEITWGESWKANVSTFNDLSHVRFQGATPAKTFKHYAEVAWLIEQMGSNPSQLGDINFAVWDVMTPSVHLNSGFTAGAEAWQDQAEAQHYTAREFRNFRILTPVDHSDHSPQEMFTQVPPDRPSPTPEPASLILFGTGLFGMASYIRRRKK